MLEKYKQISYCLLNVCICNEFVTEWKYEHMLKVSKKIRSSNDLEQVFK